MLDNLIRFYATFTSLIVIYLYFDKTLQRSKIVTKCKYICTFLALLFWPIFALFLVVKKLSHSIAEFGD